MPRKKSDDNDNMNVEVEYDGAPTEAKCDTKELKFEKPQPRPDEPHPDMAEIARLTEDMAGSLKFIVENMVEAHDEVTTAHKNLIKNISDMRKSISDAITGRTRDANPDAFNISALQFQAAMLQPCNGQILPAAVRDEIDRLYNIEKAHKISERAERVLNILIENDPILLKLPDNQDDRLILMSVLNGWYTQAYPDRAPLKLSPGGIPD